jgi:hypothetical protein
MILREVRSGCGRNNELHAGHPSERRAVAAATERQENSFPGMTASLCFFLL